MGDGIGNGQVKCEDDGKIIRQVSYHDIQERYLYYGPSRRAACVRVGSSVSRYRQVPGLSSRDNDGFWHGHRYFVSLTCLISSDFPAIDSLCITGERRPVRAEISPG